MERALDRHIEVDPSIRGGRPHIAGTRITVADIVLMHHRLGQALPEIAGRYQLDLASVFAAMAYYYDHRQAIDASMEDDETFAEAFQRNNPSLLQARLKALEGD